MKNVITGLRIRERRKALKMSQTELAMLTGYSDKTAISKIENCHSDLTQSKILTFAKALPSFCVDRIFMRFFNVLTTE